MKYPPKKATAVALMMAAAAWPDSGCSSTSGGGTGGGSSSSSTTSSSTTSSSTTSSSTTSSSTTSSSTTSSSTSGSPSCTLASTRCVAGKPAAVETCTSGGWTESSCPNLEVCADAACRPVCGLTSEPAYPTLCTFPIDDGVNSGDFVYWTDARLASPAYATGGSSPRAPIYHDPGQTWPYYWSISSSSMAYVQFKLSQFSDPQIQTLTYRAQRAGVLADPTNYQVGIFKDATSVASCSSGAVPFAWATASCRNGAPYDAELDYSGGWNSMDLSVTGDGFGDPSDLLDVNYAMLTIAP